MKKFLTLIFPAALILASASVADAADMRSRIKSVDTEAQTFTLKNGITFRINANVAPEELVPGTAVKVRYSENRGERQVRKVIIRQ